MYNHINMVPGHAAIAYDHSLNYDNNDSRIWGRPFGFGMPFFGGFPFFI
ncbi:hypothetical protein V7150_12620 [Neobacillus drentensis]